MIVGNPDLVNRTLTVISRRPSGTPWHSRILHEGRRTRKASPSLSSAVTPSQLERTEADVTAVRILPWVGNWWLFKGVTV
jgi:hypothetical protein